MNPNEIALQKRVAELQDNLEYVKKAFGEREKEFDNNLNAMKQTINDSRSHLSVVELKLKLANENYTTLSKVHNKCAEKVCDLERKCKTTENDHKIIGKKFAKEVLASRTAHQE